jgi:hypothetical protein
MQSYHLPGKHRTRLRASDHAQTASGDACYLVARAGAAVIALDNQPEIVRLVDRRMQDVPHGLTDSLCPTRSRSRFPPIHVRGVSPPKCSAEGIRAGIDGAEYLIGVPDLSSKELLGLVVRAIYFREPDPIYAFA